MFYNCPMCKKVQIIRGPEIPCNLKLSPVGMPESMGKRYGNQGKWSIYRWSMMTYLINSVISLVVVKLPECDSYIYIFGWYVIVRPKSMSKLDTQTWDDWTNTCGLLSLEFWLYCGKFNNSLRNKSGKLLVFNRWLTLLQSKVAIDNPPHQSPI